MQIGGEIKSLFLLTLQRLWITIEFYGKNGLSNHASAGAYGFLLSAPPVLLIISFSAASLLASFPELTAGMFEHIGSLFGVFDAGDFISGFLSAAAPGLAGFISAIPIFWAARLCALSIQRSFVVIFPGKRQSPLKATALTLGLGAIIIIFLFTLIMIFGFKFALDIYGHESFVLAWPFVQFLLNLPPHAFLLPCLALIILVFYRIVPAERPKWRYIIPGTLACMVFFQIFSAGFSMLVSPDRYNLIYGALGTLFLLLVNVYFFFIFFLFGAQFIMVLGASETLLFIRFRQQHSRMTNPGIEQPRKRSNKPGNLLRSKPWDKLFAAPPKPLEKYIQKYEIGDLIFSRGSQGQEVYYVLSGEAGVYLDDKCKNRIALIHEAQFFGEMDSMESEGRSASIKAETSLLVMSLPRELFRSILQTDPDTDKNIIKALSERLRTTTNKLDFE